MKVRVWEYEVGQDSVVRFEQAYGEDGPWARLFASSEGYLGTELFRAASVPGRYLTVDRFTSEDAWRGFLADHQDAYVRLQQEMAGLTLGQQDLTGSD